MHTVPIIIFSFNELNSHFNAYVLQLVRSQVTNFMLNNLCLAFYFFSLFGFLHIVTCVFFIQ